MDDIVSRLEAIAGHFMPFTSPEKDANGNTHPAVQSNKKVSEIRAQISTGPSADMPAPVDHTGTYTITYL
uniref:Uncharacterized protein n=1 Tax=viral metagenome TaxID=1070528 RepID=A0A2V0RKT0_9ZZZZ